MAFNIASILGTSLTDGIAKIISLFKIDPTVALQKQTELAELQLNIQATLENKIQDAISAQIEVNKQEAASPSLFVAGWRPWIGWTCGMAFAWAFVLQPLLTFALAAAGHKMDLPTLDLSQMMPVLLGMLGLGAMRTYEKIQGAPGSKQLQ
jgi:Holin of 3TMs, for gene-transfer release